MVDLLKIMHCKTNGDVFSKFNWRFFKQYEDKNVFICAINNPNAMFKENAKLLIYYNENLKTKDKHLTIRGSVRKWYFGKNVRRDLTKTELIDCINTLVKVLYIKKQDLLNAKITKIEIGATLTLNAKFRVMLDCMYSFPRLNRNNYKGSLYFGDKKESSYTLIFYDKLLEINKHKPKMLQKNLKANSKIFFCRYEICLNKVSQCRKFKIKTLNELLQNWEMVKQYVVLETEKIKFVDYISPIKPNVKNRKYKREYLLIQENGFSNAINDIDVLYENNRSNRKKRLEEFVIKHSQGIYKNLHNDFVNILKQKLQKLSV